MKSRFSIICLWAAFSLPTRGEPTTGENRKVTLPSGWTQSLNSQNERYESIDRFSSRIDGIFYLAKNTQIFSSHLVEGIRSFATLENFVQENCSLRGGTLLQISKYNLCRIDESSAATKSLQYFTVVAPTQTKKIKKPYVFLQFWTVPEANLKSSALFEEFLKRGTQP